jgi:hypothetical protein
MPQFGFDCRAVTVHEPPMPMNLNKEHFCVVNKTAKIPDTRFEKISPEEAKESRVFRMRERASAKNCAPMLCTPIKPQKPQNICKKPPLFCFAAKDFDKESVLVLALAAILLREKADIKLILALVYLAF